ncbi:MAG: DUF3343 domain-containing protein [Coriobacteriia bacterium]|nr:DUF3343 domain-containing protein [Coriobacteriia bacterium]
MTRAPRPWVVYGFASVHEALGAESVLKGADVTVTPVPSPKELGDLCGIALRVAPAEADHAERLLAGAGMSPRKRALTEDI